MVQPDNPSRLFWRRIAIAPLCLCAVAAWHGYRVVSLGQTPWKGGGFGMFSTVDSENARFLRCRLGSVTAGGQRQECFVPVPKGLAQLEHQACAAPTPDKLERLAKLLAEPRAENGERQVTQVIVEAWRYRFDSANDKLIVEKLSEVNYPVSPPETMP